jgi:Putative mono-oxygenase ydhR
MMMPPLIALWLFRMSTLQSFLESTAMSKIFLYAEIQVSVPFSKIDWKSINVAMKKEPGLRSKTWLSGVNTNTIGGFYEFDTLEHAKAYAVGYLAQAAQQLGGSLTVRLYDGDVTADASHGIASPFYETVSA